MNNENAIEEYIIGRFKNYTVICRKDDMYNSLIPHMHIVDDNFDAVISLYSNQYIPSLTKGRLPYEDCLEFDKFMGSLCPNISSKRTYWDLALIGWMFANDEFEYDNIFRTKPNYSIII